MRRMMDKMGLDMSELPNVQEVIIKTDKKEIILTKPSVTEMKAKDSSIFTVTADSYEERELEVPIFSEEERKVTSAWSAPLFMDRFRQRFWTGAERCVPRTVWG